MNTFVTKQEEPCEARVSSTVPWEREGEIPSRDPIMPHCWTRTEQPNAESIYFPIHIDS
jgi:hypothetical protein